AIKDGIMERIRRELPSRFPKAPLPDISTWKPIHFLAYSYLEASVEYAFQFRDDTEPVKFKDSQGRVTRVHAFGIRKEDKDQGIGAFRSQVRVLFRAGDDFAIDVSLKSKPYQLVLTRMARKSTLQATLADLEQRVVAHKGTQWLDDGAVMLIPHMNW